MGRGYCKSSIAEFLQESAQADSNGFLTFLYDGHGSTRGLIDNTQSFDQRFAYDAYGNHLTFGGFTSAAAAHTSLLYSGEWTNSDGQQYLRARWYDPASGRFNRLDPFAGNAKDPQSLHKYLYTHANPINGVDPTGMFSIGEMMASINIQSTLKTINNYVKYEAAQRAVWAVLENLAFALIPQWLKAAIGGEAPSVGLVGGSITGNIAIKGVGVGGVAGAEVLFSSKTNNIVTYTYSGITGGMTSRKNGLGACAGGYAGAVWGLSDSFGYTGTFISLTIPFGKLGTEKLRKQVAFKVTKAFMGRFGVSASFPLINKANREAALRIAKYIGPDSSFIATLFWNPEGTVGGISLGSNISVGGALNLSAAYTEYTQILPSPIGADKEIPF